MRKKIHHIGKAKAHKAKGRHKRHSAKKLSVKA